MRIKQLFDKLIISMRSARLLSMTISSINFQRVRGDKTQALDHIARTTKKEPVYLLEKSERKPNDFELLADVEKLHEVQMQLRKQNHSRGKAPDLNDSLWETVVNLDEKHSLADVKKVADFIKQKYHLTPTAIAIHRDEGYKDKTTGEVKYNYHAHVMFYTVEHGKSQMRTIGKRALSTMQTEVANLLCMQRGQEHSQAKRLDHQQYRAVKRAEDSLKQETAHWKSLYEQAPVKTQKELNELKAKIRKEMIEQGGFSAQDYRALNQLITDYKNAFKLGETVTVSEVIEDIYQRLNASVKLKTENDRLTSENKKLTNKLAELQKKVETLTQAQSQKELQRQSATVTVHNFESKQQKSSITPQKRSQSDENTIKRVEVQQTSQSQSMSVLNASQPKEKRYSVVISRQSYDLTAKDIHDWLEDYPEDKDSIVKQLSEADRREVFGEPTRTAQKQTPARVRHGVER